MSDPINPEHYKEYPYEVIEMMGLIFGKKSLRDHCLMTAFKYRMRAGHKDDIKQDLKKEEWYLNKAAELTKELLK